jgi:hypothetical protein
MEQFVADVASGEYRTNGWPANSYGVSKAGVVRAHFRPNVTLILALTVDVYADHGSGSRCGWCRDQLLLSR